MPLKRLPVTIVSGYLGAGKSTLVRKMLNGRGKPGIATVVMEAGNFNIDADLLGPQFDQTGNLRSIVTVSGDSMAGTTSQLSAVIQRLSKAESYEHVLLEMPGTMRPTQLLKMFGHSARADRRLSQVARLNEVITVADAVSLSNQRWCSSDFHNDGSNGIANGHAKIRRLLRDQIRHADTILLNKTNEAGENRTMAAKKIVTWFNSRARIVETNHCKVTDTIFADFKKNTIEAKTSL